MPGPTPAELRPQSALRDVDHDAAKRAVFCIFTAWQVNDGEARVLLGQPGRSTFYAWKKGQGGRLSHDTLARVSYVLGIYKALQLLFPNPTQADGWMKKPNVAFGGASALERALGGQMVDLAAVRQYLDFVRG